jgi:hypothetical protein
VPSVSAEGWGVSGPPELPNTARLCALLVPAAVYLAWAAFYRSAFEMGPVDGVAGVLLGLYISAHPAANGIDLIFLRRGALARALKRWNGIGWLALNCFVLFVGWLVIVAGATDLLRRRVTE